MTFRELIKSVLEEKYLGKTIKGWNGKPFVVGHITVDNGTYGDPPFDITLESDCCFSENEKYRQWNQINNPTGGNLMPQEMNAELFKILEESIEITSLDGNIPELINEL